MKENLTVTVRHGAGGKHFTLPRRAQYALLLIIAAVIMLMGTGGVVLWQQHSELLRLEVSNAELQTQKARLQQTVVDAQARMDAIELAMGLRQPEPAPLEERLRRAGISGDERVRVLAQVPNGSPVPYQGISSGYGYRIHPITKKRSLHHGSDLRAPMNTPVYATANGVVEFAGTHGNYGRLVILDHTYGFRTFYAHLNKMAVRNGSVVKKGDLIGYSGNSGRTNGPHLHYEVRFIQRALNPYWFIKWDMAHYDQIFAKVKKVSWKPILEAIASDTAASPVLMAAAKL